MLPCTPSDPPACSATSTPTPTTTAAPSPPLLTPIDALGADLASAFGGTNLLFYAGAVGGSAALALSGGDYSIRIAVQQHIASSAYGNAASLAGYIVPVVVAPAVWLTGLALGDRASTGAGSAAVQALVVTALATAVLKIGVGRAYPSGGRDPN